MSLIERLKLESELKSTVSIGKLFQRFMTRFKFLSSFVIRLFHYGISVGCSIQTFFHSLSGNSFISFRSSYKILIRNITALTSLVKPFLGNFIKLFEKIVC